MGYRIFNIQMVSRATNAAIISAGGTVFVATNGTAAKATLYDPDSDFVALSNPLTPIRGAIRFAVADTVNKVDIYVMAPGGQFAVLKDIEPGAPTELWIDTLQREQVAVIPFAIGDTTAAAETDSGFDEPADALIGPYPSVNVLTTDATITLDVGTDSNDSGNADGFLDGLSTANEGLVKGTSDNAGATIGALLYVQDSANAGDKAPEPHVSGGKSITYTLSAGADTAAGFIHLPYVLLG